MLIRDLGWERRFTADPERAKEAIELYRRLGYEVRVETEHAAAAGEECVECHASAHLQTIYTRKRRA